MADLRPRVLGGDGERDFVPEAWWVAKQRGPLGVNEGRERHGVER